MNEYEDLESNLNKYVFPFLRVIDYSSLARCLLFKHHLGEVVFSSKEIADFLNIPGNLPVLSTFKFILDPSFDIADPSQQIRFEIDGSMLDENMIDMTSVAVRVGVVFENDHLKLDLPFRNEEAIINRCLKILDLGNQ